MTNWMFWSAYLYLCLVGLVGSVYLSYQIKKYVADKVENYEEASKWGILSDVIMYPVLGLYAVASYYLSTFSS